MSESQSRSSYTGRMSRPPSPGLLCSGPDLPLLPAASTTGMQWLGLLPQTTPPLFYTPAGFRFSSWVPGNCILQRSDRKVLHQGFCIESLSAQEAMPGLTDLREDSGSIPNRASSGLCFLLPQSPLPSPFWTCGFYLPHPFTHPPSPTQIISLISTSYYITYFCFPF